MTIFVLKTSFDQADILSEFLGVLLEVAKVMAFHLPIVVQSMDWIKVRKK
jgi:hypothetical protein